MIVRTAPCSGQVWDDDEASCDFLGAAEVDLHELLDTKQKVPRRVGSPFEWGVLGSLRES